MGISSFRKQVIHNNTSTSTLDMVFTQANTGVCPAISCSWSLDLRTEAVVSTCWFKVSEEIFVSGTVFVLTKLKKTIDAVVSREG